MSQQRRSSTVTAPSGPTPFKVIPIAQHLSLEEVNQLPSNSAGMATVPTNPANQAAATLRAATSSLFRVGQATSAPLPMSPPPAATSPPPPPPTGTVSLVVGSAMGLHLGQQTVKSFVEAVELCGRIDVLSLYAYAYAAKVGRLKLTSAASS